MKQSINLYSQLNNQFGTLSETVRGTWRDNVGEAFYRDIIQPLKEQSSEMTSAMVELCSTLLELKSEIDKI